MGDKLLINGVTFQGRTDILSWDITPSSGSDLSFYYDDLCNNSNDGTQTKTLTGEPPFSFVRLDYSNPIGTVSGLIKVRFFYDNQCGSDSRYLEDFLDPNTALPIVSFVDYYSNYNPACGGSGGRRAMLDYTDSMGVVRSITLVNNGGANCVLSDFSFSSETPEQDCTNGYKRSDLTYLDSLGVERTINLVNNSSAPHKISEIAFLSRNCGVIINYIDGKPSPLLEFPECPIVEEFNDALCPQACDLATQILSKLGG